MAGSNVGHNAPHTLQSALLYIATRIQFGLLCASTLLRLSYIINRMCMYKWKACSDIRCMRCLVMGVSAPCSLHNALKKEGLKWHWGLIQNHFISFWKLLCTHQWREKRQREIERDGWMNVHGQKTTWCLEASLLAGGLVVPSQHLTLNPCFYYSRTSRRSSLSAICWSTQKQVK